MLDEPNVDRLERRRETTRREIIDAAWELVRAEGWGGLTLRQVAGRVGMRAPSLYGHFTSKGAIVDAMFADAWDTYDRSTALLEHALPADPREALLVVARTYVDFATCDPQRHALMSQRPVPGFAPSPEAYAPAVRSLARLGRVLDTLGVTDEAAMDLFTAVLGGVVGQQLANDPGGDRWVRLLPRAVSMYADEIGLPRGEAHD